jgi:hypothetical protein
MSPCLANWTWPYLLWRGAERSRWPSFALAVVWFADTLDQMVARR